MKTPEEKKESARLIAEKILSIPDNKPEQAADHRLMNATEIVFNAMAMAERHASEGWISVFERFNAEVADKTPTFVTASNLADWLEKNFLPPTPKTNKP